MIDFRYHLVSIVAVFLALAVGIVVGALAGVQPHVLLGLQTEANNAKRQIDSLLATGSALKQQVSADENFAQAAAPRLLPGLLTGQQVVIVVAPGADPQTISGITAAVQQAGAKVTGQVGLQQALFDTTSGAESKLIALAGGLDPGGVSPASQAAGQAAGQQIPGQEAAAQVIAAALVTGKRSGWSSAQSQKILSGLGGSGYLQVSNGGAGGGTALSVPATLAVVVIPSTPPASDTDPANLALIAVAQQLQTASYGTVVAGSLPGTGPGSAIDEISSTGNIQLTTVDSADLEVGQIAVAQALHNLLNGQKPASFGVRPGIFPSPAPSPAATVSADPAANRPARKPASKR